MTDFNIADLFEKVADAIPDREALVCGDRRLTYRELDERATRLAHVLAAHGVRAGDHVGLHLYNSTEYLEGMIAAFKLRAVPINVNYRYVADELRYLFNDAELKVAIHEPGFAELIDAIRDDVPTLQWTVARGDDYERELAAASAERDFEPRSGDDLYILYTGGTTGMPKGVMWRQDDVFVAAFGGAGVSSDDEVVERVAAGRTRCLPACPFMHGTAHWMAFSTFFGGGTVVVSPGAHMDPAAIWQLIADENVTFLVIVGDAFARPLVDALDPDPEARPDLTSLGAILSGGAILSPAVKDALIERLPGVIVVDGYGASETGGQGQMVAAPGASAGARPRFMVGPDTQVVDDDLRPVDPGSGVIGRVARRGRVPLGYFKDEAKTAATFPTIDGERWAVPGDLAMVEADGTVTLLGRGSVSINTGGEKVFPEEVESALKSHPSVFDAVVVGVPDDRWGQRVTAVVSLRRNAGQPTLEELADHCRTSIAGYKVPRSLAIVDSIVRSPSGKPDYRWARSEAEKQLA
ncbi:MAG TPA: acyl-CoA synthetase [Acidimicrobiales bacterium]|jgi:3-oxocholest-4-en-26-oate---CoA ligase|nr:acyl-CoA synthetase [Acidimicrobiales bacterium]